MKEVIYNEIIKYDERKADIIKQFHDESGVVREGFDNDLFISAVLRIIDYFNYNLPNIAIKREDIPDVNEFKNNSRVEYSISKFIFNRIEKNIKAVKFYEEIPTYKSNKKAIGGYNWQTNTLEIYKNNFKRYIQETAKDQSEDYKRLLSEEVLVHEIIHAISKTNTPNLLGFRYIDEKGNKRSVSVNEGVTESLAIDICNLKDIFFTTSNEEYMVNANTLSAYKLEVNIANLIKIAYGDRFYLKYLVDASRISLLRDNNDVMKIVIGITNNHTPSRELSNEKIADYQRIQEILIKDIFDNKLQKELLDDLRQGKSLDIKKFKRLRKDLYIIGNCLIPSLNDANLDEDLNFNSTKDHIKEMIEQGKIKLTDNIEKYMLLVGAMKEIERDFKVTSSRKN